MAIVLSKCRYVLLACNVTTVYIALGLLLSLQPPFYPSEAEKKGATPGQYGFVFGIANLSLFMFSPIFGKFGARIGAKLCFNIGAVMQGLSGFVFAFLPSVDSVGGFIGLSYLLRFLEGMGTAMAWSAALGILMKIFPNKVARVMSWTQTCFGLGYMLGPAVGAALYGIGGFMLPFLVVGALSTALSLCLIVTIPKMTPTQPPNPVLVPSPTPTSPTHSASPTFDSPSSPANGHAPTPSDTNSHPNNIVPVEVSELMPVLRFRTLFTSLRLFLPFVDLFAALCGNGMLESMLEPHLRDTKATTMDVGITFLIFGCSYMLGNVVFGFIMDKFRQPIVFSILGNIFFMLAFLLIGPVPFIPLLPSMRLMQGMMVLAGAAYSVMVVSSFSRAQKRVLELGFSDDIHTYVMISGIWMSAFALGNFAGPTLGGIIVEQIAFRHTTTIFFAMYCIMLVVDCLQWITLSMRESYQSEYERIG